MLYRLGMLAQDIRSSITTLVYRAMAADAGLAISYEIQNVSPGAFPEALKQSRKSFDGLTISMPYKQLALRFADDLDESARVCGSANVLKIRNKKITAYSTDGWGLVKYLDYLGCKIQSKRAVLFGAGGVAHSIAYFLRQEGIGQVDVLNLCPSQAEELCTRMGGRFTPYPLQANQLADCCADADLFINATSLGQLGCDDFQDLRFLQALSPSAVVVDVNYANPKARLVPAAQQLGLRAVDGKGMSVFHALRALYIWTGKMPSEQAAVDLIKSFS